MRKTTELLIYGIVLIGLAIIDIYTLVLDFNAGLLEMLTTTDVSMETAKIVLYVVVGLAVWSILVGLFLGIKGVVESRNPSGSRLHIFLARFVGVINLVLAVILGLSLLDSTDLWHDLETFVLCMVDLIFMFSYASAAKAVRNGEN
jgi:hypothetical protein